MRSSRPGLAGPGRSWPCPSCPGSPPQRCPRVTGDVIVLSGGAFLAIHEEPWELLAPGARTWCAVRSGRRSRPVSSPSHRASRRSAKTCGGRRARAPLRGSRPTRCPLSPCRADSSAKCLNLPAGGAACPPTLNACDSTPRQVEYTMCNGSTPEVQWALIDGRHFGLPGGHTRQFNGCCCRRWHEGHGNVQSNRMGRPT